MGTPQPVLRRGVLLLVPLVLCACVVRHPSAAPLSPDGLIVVFADGFHSGVILARDEAPAELLPPGYPDLPWVAIHFGERRWISGDADGVFDALRLAVAPGDGGVQVDRLAWWVHDRGGTDRSRLRIWVFPVDAAALAGLRASVRRWITPGATASPLRPGACWWSARRDWSLRNNCHDFTADVLEGAGIAVARPPIMTAAPLRAALDRAWAWRDADGP